MLISTVDTATPHGVMQFTPCLILNASDTVIQVQNCNNFF